MNIQLPYAEQQEDKATAFSKQFYNLFHRAKRIRNFKKRVDFFKALMPVQQKRRRVPIISKNSKSVRINNL